MSKLDKPKRYSVFQFIKLIPAFYRLFHESEMEPEDIRFSLLQYMTVIHELTGGLMSKLNYYANDSISLVHDRYCDGCELKDGEQERLKYSLMNGEEKDGEQE